MREEKKGESKRQALTKNQEQRRTFHIALLTKKVSTPILEGVYGIFVHTYLLKSSNCFTKESANIFTKCVPRKHLQASSRRGSKCTLGLLTLRNWLRSVANKKARIFDPSRGYLCTRSKLS